MDYRSTQPPTLYASYQQPTQPQQPQPSAMPDSFEDMYNNNGTGALVRVELFAQTVVIIDNSLFPRRPTRRHSHSRPTCHSAQNTTMLP